MQLTKNQQQILSLIQQQDTEVSAQQLYVRLRQQGSKMGLSTVYRALKTLHGTGKIQERVTPMRVSFYSPIQEKEDYHHHPHLNCINCGQSISLYDHDCPVDEQLIQWCQSQNFKVYYHTLEFFGFCCICQNQIEE